MIILVNDRQNAIVMAAANIDLHIGYGHRIVHEESRRSTHIAFACSATNRVPILPLKVNSPGSLAGGRFYSIFPRFGVPSNTSRATSRSRVFPFRSRWPSVGDSVVTWRIATPAGSCSVRAPAIVLPRPAPKSRNHRTNFVSVTSASLSFSLSFSLSCARVLESDCAKRFYIAAV